MISTHPDKSGYPVAGWEGFECYDLRQLCNFVTGLWSPMIWCGNKRHETVFSCAYWCALDYDEGLTKAEAREVFKGYRYLLGPTKSDGIEKFSDSGRSKPACDRYRVVLPFARPIFDIEVFRYNMKLAANTFKTDVQAVDAARVWQPCASVETIVLEGVALDVVTEVPVEETQAFKSKNISNFLERKRKGSKLPPRTFNFLAGNIRPGEINKELYVACCTLFTYGWTVAKVRESISKIPAIQAHDKIESTIKSAARKTGADYY